MPLYDKIGKTGGSREDGRQVTPDEMRQEIGRIRNDPGAYLRQRGFSIPDGLTDPREITQHLLRSGQVGSGRLRQVMSILGAPGAK